VKQTHAWKILPEGMQLYPNLRNKVLKPVLVILIITLVAPVRLLADNNASYSLGVFPHLPPRDLEKVFAPLAGDLGKAVHKKVLLNSSATFDKFAANLDEEEYDIAFVQPFDYIRAADEHGYLPLATRKEKLSAIIVTRQDSPLKSLNDLRGKKLALPPSNSAVSRLLRAYLWKNGINPDRDIELIHFRTHFSCMQQVIIGEVVACGTAPPTRRYFEGKYNVILPVIAETRGIPHALWIVHKRVPLKDRKILLQRILSWGKTKEGRRMLADGRLAPYVPVTDAAYDVVRKLAKQASGK
jgi:phosphonate transport system substrate-binding protein